MKYILALLILIGCNSNHHTREIPVSLLNKSRNKCNINGGLSSISAVHVYHRNKYGQAEATEIFVTALCVNGAQFGIEQVL